MPERRMPRKVFFSLRTATRARAALPSAPPATAYEIVGRVGLLQKSAGITAVFVFVEDSWQVPQSLPTRSARRRSWRAAPSWRAMPEKKLRRTVDSKKNRD
jgi:hypothetical protein